MPSTESKYIDSSDFATATAVYDDINLTIKASDGVYQYDGEYRTQQNGLLGPLFQCEECSIPCGGTINPPSGGQGLYQLEFNAGTGSDDTGAILIYFNPNSVPDGIRVLYDGVYYNRLSSPTDGNIQSTSGISDAFTILGSAGSSCVPSTPNTTSYDFFDGFSGGTWDSGTPTPQSITLNVGDDVRGGSSEFSLLVIPKTNSLPGNVTIQVLGPCSGTAWQIEVDCPAALPSFEAIGVSGSMTCFAPDTTLYFGRFRNETNVYPELNNPVFLDANGSNRASDQNYVMDNNQVITVTNGVVSNIQSCTP